MSISTPLDEREAAADPFAQFSRWMDEAEQSSRLAAAAALATAATNGRPSIRMVLVVAWDDSGFVFHSDYRSRKAIELAANPNAALLFDWDERGRQVRIEGTVAPIAPEESDAYAATRARAALIVEHASQQSASVESRSALLGKVSAVEAAFGAEPIARPATWGGYRLRPQRFEFWQHRDDRLHDRLLYEAQSAMTPDSATPASTKNWQRTRLQP